MYINENYNYVCNKIKCLIIDKYNPKNTQIINGFNFNK